MAATCCYQIDAFTDEPLSGNPAAVWEKNAAAQAEAATAPETRMADGDEEPKKKRGFWGRIFGSRKKAPEADRPDDRPEPERQDPR